MQELELKIIEIDKLKPHPKNPRIHPKSALEKLKRSIQEFGWTNPVLVSEDGFILAGHARVKAAKELGIKEVPVIFLPLTGEKAEAYMIADNKLQELTEWDTKSLEKIMKELKEADIDLEITGFSDKEIKKMLGEIESRYTRKIQTPIYEPVGRDVILDDLVNSDKYEELIKEIEVLKVSNEEKKFLKFAATRFLEFNFSNIAEYYAGKANKEMQEIMEKLALVIIDFDKAIEFGFVELSERLEDILKDTLGVDVIEE